MKKFTLKIPIYFWVFASFIILSSYLFYYLFFPKTVQETTNFDKSHSAKLIRYDGIDVNFKVIVDEKKVFFSPDFAPVEYDFRERLIWNETGSIIVLEVAGKRLFGYDVRGNIELSNTELSKVKFAPFSKYGYEGKLPKNAK